MSNLVDVYVVVEFINEQSVSVVHKSWIEGSGEDAVCYWPPSSKNVYQRVRRGEIPDKDRWNIHSIRTVYHTDDFDKAVQYCNKAEETSNIESDVEQARIRKKPDRLISDFDENNNEEHDDEELPIHVQKKRIQKRQREKNSDSNDEESEHELRKKLPVAPQAPTFTPNREGSRRQDLSPRPVQLYPITPNRDVPRKQDPTPRTVQSTSGRSNQDSSCNCQTVIVQKLITLEDAVKDIKTALTQLGARESVMATAIVEEVIEHPCNFIHDMRTLSENMNEEVFKKKLVQYLVSQGGHSPSNCIRRMMKKCGTNLLWAKYSLKGQKGKEAFICHPLCRIIMKCCARVFPKTKVVDMEEVLIDFLKQAHHKPGGPKYKKPAKKSTVNFRRFGVRIIDHNFTPKLQKCP